MRLLGWWLHMGWGFAKASAALCYLRWRLERCSDKELPKIVRQVYVVCKDVDALLYTMSIPYQKHETNT